MKPRGKNAGRILGEFFGRVPKSSPSQMEAAYPRMWNRIRLDMSAHPAQAEDSIVPPHRRRRWVLMAAAAVVALMVTGGIYRETLERHALTRTALSIVSGDLRRIESQPALQAGQRHDGRHTVLSTNGAVFQLEDGSRVEVRPKSQLNLEAADDGTSIRLNRGSVLVTAAKQRTGHLYVQTRDLTVSVVGTVFLVNAEEAGSRVTVIEGEVHVEQQGSTVKTLLPGGQVVSNPLMTARAVPEELSWTSMQPQAKAPPPEFESAVLRFTGIQGPRSAIECRGIDGVWSLESDILLNTLPRPARAAASSTTPLGRCVGSAHLRAFIAAAYDVRMDRISGEPQMYFQLEARAEDPARTTVEELRQMLRSLVMDRFKPKVYREAAEADGFVLSVAKSGMKFKEVTGDEEGPLFAPIARDGSDHGLVLQGKFGLRRFVNVLSTMAGGPIVDRTNLSGIYELKLALSQPVREASAGSPRGGRNTNVDIFDPPMPVAIEEQLGLRLEALKVPVEYLVVTQVETPEVDRSTPSSPSPFR
jgi:uncharacterized protein (TIGR03435 family)